MSDVTLSSAVRSNLLSLQNTADMMSKTQERLATGLKVNSALDNPTNFFTASALNSRASDLGRLLDGVSNATQTLEAADNGISAITKLVESAQATARQALQTPSTIEQAGTGVPATLATADSGNTTGLTVGAATNGSLTGSGTFGTVDLTGAGSPATSGTASGTAFSTIDLSGTASPAEGGTLVGGTTGTVDLSASNDLTISVDDGNGAQTITLDAAAVSQFTGGGGVLSGTQADLSDADVAALINQELADANGGAGVAVTATVDSGAIRLTTDAQGSGETLTIGAVGGTQATTSGLDDIGFANQSDSGVDAETADSVSFNIDVDGGGAEAITIDAAAVSQFTGGGGSLEGSLAALSGNDLAALINQELGDADGGAGVAATATFDGTSINIASDGTGATSSIEIDSYADDISNGGATGIANTSSIQTGDDATAAASLTLAVTVDGGGEETITIDNAALTQFTGGGGTLSGSASALSGDDLAALINQELGDANGGAGLGATASFASGAITLTSDGAAGTGSTVALGTVGGTQAANSGLDTSSATNGTANTVGNVTINGQTVALEDGDDAAAILGKFQAAATASSGTNAFTVSDSSGTLTFTGTDGNDLVIGGDADAVAAVGLTAGTVDGTPANTPTVEVANPARAEFVTQYNELMGQINELAEDSGFNGVNLLDGDNLSVIFNEDGSSTLDITGETFDATGLGLAELGATGLNTDAAINTVLGDLDTAIGTLRSQSSEFGSNLSIVETREDFTKSMINTLETGAANLTLADTNEEGANLLALQTRQQLSSTALSLASQADQNVLRLF